jgi:hypothetical protein
MTVASMSAHDLFNAFLGLGIVVCLGTGAICAFRAGTDDGSAVGDALDIRGHWRGWVKAGLAMMAVGIVGLIGVAIAN